MNSSDEFFEQEREEKCAQKRKVNLCLDKTLSRSDHKKRLYEAVYESEWIDYYRPKVSKLINLNTIVVHNLSATAMSLLK